MIVSSGSLKALVSKHLKPYWASDSRPKYWGFADESYYLPNMEELTSFLAENPLREELATYGEVFDCDDYAFVMKGGAGIHARAKGFAKGWALGIVWGAFTWKSDPAHACNWAILADRSLRWIEPQTNLTYPISNSSGEITLILV